MQNKELTDWLMTAKEAGEYLGLAEGTIRNKASRNEIPFVKLGVALRFRKSELDRWVEEQTAAHEERSAA
jgi:excisionase family DNA binding protein